VKLFIQVFKIHLPFFRFNWTQRNLCQVNHERSKKSNNIFFQLAPTVFHQRLKEAISYPILKNRSSFQTKLLDNNHRSVSISQIASFARILQIFRIFVYRITKDSRNFEQDNLLLCAIRIFNLPKKIKETEKIY